VEYLGEGGRRRVKGDTGKKKSKANKRGECIMFWNIAGVSNKNKDFWNYVGKFDFVRAYVKHDWKKMSGKKLRRGT